MSDLADPPPGRKGLPLLGETLEFMKDGFGFIDRRIAEFGPVFATSILGRETAVIAGPDACTIWTNPDLIERRNSQPGPIYKIFAGPSLPHLDDQAHRDRKELVLSGFTTEATASYVPGLQAAVRSRIETWVRLREFRWIDEFKKLAIEGIAANFLGERPGPQLESLVRDYDLVTKGIGAIPIALPGTPFGRAIAARDRILARFSELIRRREAREDATGVDGLARILTARLPDGTRLSADAAMRELHHIIIAGYIIFAEFGCLVLELHRHPEIRRRVEEEIRSRVGAGTLTLETLADLPYLTRVVMETKRICPILPAIFGRSRKEFTFKGRTIPAGWMVLWALRVTLMDHDTYTSPEIFDPERFSDERAEHKRHEHAFVPHGPGPITTHQCPGTDYATIFMKVFAIHLVRSGVAWKLPPQEFECDWSLTPPEPKGGLRVTFGKA